MENHRSVLGIDETTTAQIGYVLAPVALLLILIERKNNFVRFHAFQSVLYAAASVLLLTAYSVLTGLVFFGSSALASDTLGSLGSLLTLLSPLAILAWFAGLVFISFNAYGGNMYKLPVIGKLAEKWAGSTSRTPA